MDRQTAERNLYLGLGSNLGGREENLKSAMKLIEEKIGKVVSCSPFYATEPVGFVSDNFFLNCVCHVRTSKQALDVLKVSQEIEILLGRRKKSMGGQYADRTIDIDILLIDDLAMSHHQLELPHPHMHERGFVVIPFADIAGETMHPTLKKTIGELKSEFLAANATK